MTLSDLIAAFRTEAADQAEPPLWSDAEIAGYLADDRRRLERALSDGELLGVATTALVKVAGQAFNLHLPAPGRDEAKQGRLL